MPRAILLAVSTAAQTPPRTRSASPGGLLGGRYQILKHLASGGMAEVHLARATGIGGFERYVVVKTILGEHARDPRFVTMFLDEARLAAQLHHQNIAQVFDIGEEDGTYFFTMEYVHGVDARTLLRKAASKRQPLPIEHAVAIVAGAAAGLHYAHDKRGPDRQPLGLVHRDVSPSNLLVAYDGAVKLVDFGIAKAASRSTETRSGTLKGKVAYMSPEQCLGRPIDRRSDVFSLGVVLFELTTLTRLFKFENDYVTMHQIVTGELPSPRSRRADFPADLEPIVMKCLARDLDQRYQSAGELLEALDAYAREHRLMVSPQALGRYVRETAGERPEPWLELEPEPPRHVSLLDEDDEEQARLVTESQVPPARIGVTVETVPDTGAPRPAAAPVTATRAPRRRRWPIIAALIATSGAVGGVLAWKASQGDAPAPVIAPAERERVETPGAGAGAAAGTGAAAATEADAGAAAVTDAGAGAAAAADAAADAGAATATGTTTTTTTTTRKKPPRRSGARTTTTEPRVEPAPTTTTTTTTPPAPPKRDPSILKRPSQKKDAPP